MSDWMLLYAFSRLDAIGGSLATLGAVGVVATVILVAVGLLFKFEDPKAYNGLFAREAQRRNGLAPQLLAYGKRTGISTAAVILLATAMPSKSDIAIIVGGKIALDVGRSETAQEVGQEVLDAIRAQLKKAAQ